MQFWTSAWPNNINEKGDRIMRSAARSQQEARLEHVARVPAGRGYRGADKYLAPEYHQHNPNADTGRAAVKEYFRAAGMQKSEVKDYIERLVAITAERDLVTLALVREEVDSNGEAYTTTWFDMFRVQDGRIVEHWDTATRP
jgi:predicted SnoaL-like aldol condensation-catalyzing enzyme